MLHITLRCQLPSITKQVCFLFLTFCYLSIYTKPLIAGEKLIGSGPQLTSISTIENVGELFQITQDQQGFLYFASSNGLVRFDGYQTQIFMSKHQNQYHHIANGKGQNLWLAGTKGLSKFDLNTQSFSFYAQTDIYDMSVNGDQIWLATKQGIKYFDNNSQTIKAFDNKTPIKQNINFILITKDQQLWFTSLGKGAIKLNLNNQSYQVFNQQTVNDDKFSNLITTLAVTENNQVWLGSDKGLHHHNKSTNHFDFYQLPVNSINVKDQYDITHIYQDKDNNIWVSTLHNGIVVKKLPLAPY